jgi:YidC/Oxa1 family membrane protein insertase
MADSVNGGNNSVNPPKEMSMELRLLLALLLTIPILFLGPYFFGSPTPTPKKAAPAAVSTAAPADNPAAAPQAAQVPAIPEVSAASSSTPATPQQSLPLLNVNTGKFRVSFSNQGATVRSWLLKEAKGNDGKPLEVVNSAAGIDYPFAIYFPGEKDTGKNSLTSKANWSYYTQTVDPDGLGVRFDYSDGHIAIKKSFRFEKDSYLSQVVTSVTRDGQPVPHMIAWRGGFGDFSVPNPSGVEHGVYFDLASNKLQDVAAKAASKGPVTAAGSFSFAGLTDPYFAAVFLPEGNGAMQQTTFADSVRTALEPKPEQFVGAAVSNGDENRFKLFVGPKDVDLLKRVDPKLEQLVDFGWMSFLAKPLFLIVNWANDTLVHNFGWSIVLVTIIINFILFPLKLSNMKSMRKMQALKPQIDAINSKYKGMSLRDPKKADQNAEVMDLYKKNGVNPMGGCLPMALQLPFFFAFYRVFTVSVEMRGAPWLWVTDLSQPEHLAIRILPLVMIASQFFMQKMMPQPNADPAQQKMTMFMPLIFGFMFYNFASGLVLYYLTSNLVSMGQQWFFNHTEVAKKAELSIEPPPKKKNNRK